MEELEDEEGNVYNKKVYNDLKAQGRSPISVYIGGTGVLILFFLP